jgi:predicted enzyme related to lactoylglutathione lyase
MIQKTAVVWLPVSDMKTSLSFYKDQLGLKELQAESDWSMLDAGGLNVGLNASESPSGDGGAVLAFEPEGGLEDAVQKLRDGGVDVPGEITEHPWGRIATFKDPDGNDLQFYESPSD